MSEKENPPIKRYALLSAIVFLVIVSVLVTHRLFTAEYPTPFGCLFHGSGMWSACMYAVGFVIFDLSISISFSDSMSFIS